MNYDNFAIPYLPPNFTLTKRDQTEEPMIYLKYKDDDDSYINIDLYEIDFPMEMTQESVSYLAIEFGGVKVHLFYNDNHNNVLFFTDTYGCYFYSNLKMEELKRIAEGIIKNNRGATNE